jgi:hypothetical protein
MGKESTVRRRLQIYDEPFNDSKFAPIIFEILKLQLSASTTETTVSAWVMFRVGI